MRLRKTAVAVMLVSVAFFQTPFFVGLGFGEWEGCMCGSRYRGLGVKGRGAYVVHIAFHFARSTAASGIGPAWLNSTR